MPNVFLNGDLFSAAIVQRSEASWQHMVILAFDSKTFIESSGYRLYQFDLRVYAVCLRLFIDLPIVTDDQEACTEITYGMLAALVSSRSASGLIALRESLFRLSRTRVATPSRRGKKDEYGEMLPPKGRSVLRIRIPLKTAYLCGPNAWTAAPDEALKMTGLTGWLAEYCASHSTSFALLLSFLHRIPDSCR